jgi:hypothetical protein
VQLLAKIEVFQGTGREQWRPSMSDKLGRADLAQQLTIASTEQYILTMSRSNTMSDLSQRAGMFFTSVSSALVALALVAQATKFGETFLVLACAICITLYVLGLLTYVRAIQQSIEDMHLACGVNRIRHFYTEVAPDLAPYFLNSVHDDYIGILSDMGLRHNRFQGWLTTASAIALVEAALGSAVAGLAPVIFMHVSMYATIAAAVVAFLISLLIMSRLAATVRANSLPHVSMFPTPSKPT